MSEIFDAKLIKPFIEGTIQTLKIQCSIEAKPGKPYIKAREDGKGMKIDIAGIIGLTSDNFQGSISICFPQQTFLNVMEKMIGEKHTEITNELQDGAGELLNIIFGSAKRVLNDGGYTIQKAIPSVIRGQSIVVHHLTATPIVVLPFESESGLFQIEVGIESKK